MLMFTQQELEFAMDRAVCQGTPGDIVSQKQMWASGEMALDTL